MVENPCKNGCLDGSSLPRLQGTVVSVSCECGRILHWDTAKSFAEAGSCGCGLSVAEGIVHGPHRDQVIRLAPLRPAPNHDANVVYFARTWDGLIKIGTTADVWQRVRNLRAELLGVVPGAYQVEASMHRRFAEHREHGEFFRPHRDLLAFIEDQTSMPAPPNPSSKRNPAPFTYGVAIKQRQDIY